MNKYLTDKEFINSEIKKYFDSINVQNQFQCAALYIIGPDGHRYRSLISLAIYERMGGKREEYTESLIGIECLHASSLIFDDLPAFDNSDMRKGKTSVHLKFSESTAILAGLYLMNTGQYLLSRNLRQHHESYSTLLQNQDLIYETINKMFIGEELDLLNVKNKKDLHSSMILKNDLFTFSCILPSLSLNVADSNIVKTLKKLAIQIAEAYQLFDDLRDISNTTLTGKPINMDTEKNTSLYRYGENNVKEMLSKQKRKMISTVKNLDNSEHLQYLINYIFSTPS